MVLLALVNVVLYMPLGGVGATLLQVRLLYSFCFAFLAGLPVRQCRGLWIWVWLG